MMKAAKNAFLAIVYSFQDEMACDRARRMDDDRFDFAMRAGRWAGKPYVR
jgi:hypothetical protein